MTITLDAETICRIKEERLHGESLSAIGRRHNVSSYIVKKYTQQETKADPIHKWTDTEIRAIYDEFGYSATCEYVRTCGKQKKSVVSRCKTCGYEFTRDKNILRNPQKKLRCPKCNERFIAEVLDYYQAGHSSNECAERFGITRYQVNNFAKRNGVHGGMSKEKMAEYAKAAQKKAVAASVKKAQERAKVKENDKRIKSCFKEITDDLAKWRRQIATMSDGNDSMSKSISRLGAKNRAIECFEPKTATCKHCGKQWVFWPDHRKKYGRVSNPPAYCSKKCNYKHFKTGTISDRLRKRGRSDERRDLITLDEVIKRDNGICYICGRKTSKEDSWTDANGYHVCGPTYPTRDHVIPIAKGGTHTWDNVRLACRDCNSIKNDRTLEEVSL